MFVHKWYCWVIGLTIIAAGVTIPVAVYFALDASDACSTEDTSTCTTAKGNCTNIESTWKCDCKDGYINAAGDTQTCEDINECSTGDTSSCEADKGSCINLESTWRCQCKEGYRNTEGNTQACEDINECSTGDSSSCEADKGSCINMESTWRCECKEGYKNAVGNTQACEDIDECLDGDTSSCEAGKGNCANIDSAWKCDCNDGYWNAGGDMQSCDDVDECIYGDTSSCEAGKGNCMNMDSTWKCDCNDGYKNAEGDTQTCEDVDECIDGDTSSCEAGKGNCMNMDSTWKCDCNDGYKNAEGDTQTCEDVNECIDGDTSSCEAGKGNCVNMDSTWKCDCNDGYRNAEGDPQTCEDVDECIEGDTSSCEAGKGNCINVDSTWNCDCDEGYGNADGDMHTCEDIDECSTGDASSCEAGKGSCINLEGTWRCDCDEGYLNSEGDTQTCEDIDECSTGDTSSCEAGKGSCINVEGTWRCDCDEGYRNPEGDTQTCEEAGICDSADTSSCNPTSGSCVETESSWKCQCFAGYFNLAGEDQTCEVDLCGISSVFATEEGELEFPSGSLPEYRNNVDCAWTLTVPLGKVFILTFTEFGIQNHSECGLDYLELQDGFDQESPDTNKFCGETKPGTDGVYITKHNSIRLAFHSDESETMKGFKVTWKSDVDECYNGDTTSCEAEAGTCLNVESTWMCQCNEGHKNPEGDTQTCGVPLCGMTTEFTTDEGELEFPVGDGLMYPHNADCAWTLSTTPDKMFVLTFTRFDIDETPSCEHDYLKIQRLSGQLQYAEEFCGTTEPGSNGVYNASDYNVLIGFHSESGNGEGFKLTWHTVENPCAIEDTSSCEAGTGECVPLNSLNSTWMCDCYDAHWHADGDTKICEFTACGTDTEFTTTEGELNFPAGGLLAYLPYLHCVWTLSTTPGKMFSLKFNIFVIEFDATCKYDYLEIQHGLSPESPVVDRLCGYELPGSYGVYSVYASDIRLVFRSDSMVEFAGFGLTWTTVEDYCSNANTSSCVPSTGSCVNSESAWICVCSPGYDNPIGDNKTCVVAECGNKTETSPGEGSLEYPGNGSLHYENDDYCFWILTATPGKMLHIKFSNISIEWHADCAYDYLEIQDTSMDESVTLGRFCGNELPGDDGVFITTLSEVRLEFSSNGVGYAEGFKLTWISVDDHCATANTTSCEGTCLNLESTWMCGCNRGYANSDEDIKTCVVAECGNKTETSAGEGSLDYPGYGLPYYEINDYCIWILTAPPGKVLTLTFSKIDIEFQTVCWYDKLEIHDPSAEENGLLARLCGNQLPGDNGVFTTKVNEIRLVFHSDMVETFGGFTLTWTSVVDYCSAANTSSCVPSAGSCVNTESAWICDCRPGYVNPIGDEETCVVAECGNKTETSPGEGSLEYPGDGSLEYENNDYCFWILTATPGKMLHLTFSKLSIEWNSYCVYDYLEIYDTSMDETGSLARFCGTELPGDDGVFRTTLSEVRLVFSSNEFTSAEGFKLTWTSVEDHCATADTTSCVPSTGTCLNLESTWMCGCSTGYANLDGDTKTCLFAKCGNQTETSPGEGSLEYPGYGFPNYENNDYCIWNLTAPSGKVLTLTFSKIDIEFQYYCSYDFLEIHDPSMEEDGLVDTFCGYFLPGDNGVVTTNLNEIRLVFRSDEIENFEGFTLTWTSE